MMKKYDVDLAACKNDVLSGLTVALALVPEAIAFAWTYRAGDVFQVVEPIEIKSHGDRAKSIFRHGYDYLRRLIINISDRADEFFESLSIIAEGDGSHNALKNIMRA